MTKTWKIVTGAALGLALVAGAGAAIAHAQGPMGPGGFRGRGPGGAGGPGGPGGPMGMIPGLRELNLTDTQREQIKAVMDAHKGEFDAQMQKAGPARKALNDAVMAETFNEATVRQKATDLAAAEADGAVLRAKVFSEVWALLTPEQQTRARELKAQAEQRMGQMRQQFEQRRGQRQSRPKRGQ